MSETADILPFPGNSRARSTLLPKGYVEILKIMAHRKEPISVGLFTLHGVEAQLVGEALNELQKLGLVAACVEPDKHFRLTPKGRCAAYNGATIHERTDSLLAKAGLKKIGERNKVAAS